MAKTRAGWDETTGSILACLAKRDATVEQIARTVKAGEGNVSTILLRLTRAGHVSREWISQGRVDLGGGASRSRYVYIYSITERGEARLSRING